MNFNREKRIAHGLVTKALKLGYSISVYDGEEYTLRQSKDELAIMAALGSTDQDTLTFWSNGKRLGFIWLIWGNSEDLVTDHTDNDWMRELVEDV